MYEAIDRAREFSEERLKKIRLDIKEIVPAGEVVLACGSFARREASQDSDIDCFFISQSPSPEAEWQKNVEETLLKIVSKGPAEDGAFMKNENSEEMLRHIGGHDDTNQKLTRRILFLLEGEWLFNADGLKTIRRKVLERYIADGMTDHQLSLFLLNDIIRYYRTIAVDYEFKTVEGEIPKPWAIRNIKLIFSRKLLYASGLFSVAMTTDRRREQKISLLENLFDMPVIDRMTDICGPAKMAGVLKSYNLFLERLEDAAVRTRLNGLGKNERNDPLFRELKNEGHHFTRELLKLFEEAFDSTHPIRRAVVF